MTTLRRYLLAPTWQTTRDQSLATDRCFTQLAGRRLKKASIPSAASGLSQAPAKRVILSLMRRSLTGVNDKASALAALMAPGAAGVAGALGIALLRRRHGLQPHDLDHRAAENHTGIPMTDLSPESVPHIQHQDDLAKYAPPGHAGTVNVRLCDKCFCAGFEMVLGEIAPGGEAEKHHHAAEHQAIYVLQGHARVTLAEAPAVDCPPGTIVRLPPGLDHHVLSLGPGPLKLLMVYSPPLPERSDTPLKGKPGNAT